MNLWFRCEYDGAGFHGFQRQPGLRTVQEVLEIVINGYLGFGALPNRGALHAQGWSKILTGPKVEPVVTIMGSGRTDAGAHAHGQSVGFKMPANNRAEVWADLQSDNSKVVADALFKMCAAINAFLPKDVSVRDLAIAPAGFNARTSAKRKTYVYRVFVSPNPSPLRAPMYHQIYKMPNLDKMRAIVAKEFIGRHDFVNYSVRNTKEDTVREIYDFKIENRGFMGAPAVEGNDDEIWFTITGNGFLHKMVRTIVGKLLTGQFSIAPANGLTLWNVEY